MKCLSPPHLLAQGSVQQLGDVGGEGGHHPGAVLGGGHHRAAGARVPLAHAHVPLQGACRPDPRVSAEPLSARGGRRHPPGSKAAKQTNTPHYPPAYCVWAAVLLGATKRQGPPARGNGAQVSRPWAGSGRPHSSSRCPCCIEEGECPSRARGRGGGRRTQLRRAAGSAPRGLWQPRREASRIGLHHPLHRPPPPGVVEVSNTPILERAAAGPAFSARCTRRCACTMVI